MARTVKNVGGGVRKMWVWNMKTVLNRAPEVPEK